MGIVSGATVLRTLTNGTGVTIGTTTTTGGTVFLTGGTGGGRAFSANANGAADDPCWMDVSFPAPENFSIQGFVSIGMYVLTGGVFSSVRTKALNGITVRLYSGGDYREWQLGGSDGSNAFLIAQWNAIIINPRSAGIATVGAYNPAAITGFRFQIIRSGATSARFDFIRLLRVNPLTLTGTEGVFADFYNYMLGVESLGFYLSSQTFGSDSIVCRLPLKVGDGVTSTVFSDFAKNIIFPWQDSSANPQLLHLEPGDLGITTDNATTTLQNNLLNLNNQNDLVFEAGTNLLGGVIEAAREIIIDGNISRTIFNAGGPMVYSETATYANVTLSGKAVALYVGPSFNGQTIELSVFTFESNTVNVQVDTAAVTLNLSAAQFAQYNIDPANFPITTINGGSVTVTGPVATTTFTGFPTANNANGVAPAPVIGFYSSASSAGFIAGLDTSAPEYSAGSFTVLLSDYPGVTHVVGDAMGWIRTDYIPVDALNPPSSVSLAAAFREIVSETGVALVGNGTVDGKTKLTYDQANTRFEVAAGPITFADALDKKEELTSNVSGLENFETATVRGIQFISSKYGNEILLPNPLTIAAAETASTSPILEDFLVVRAGDPTADPFEHGLTSTALELTDRPEVRMISTLFISGSAGGGAAIDAQDVADALKLAPSAGTPAAGSVYAELDALLAGTGGALSYDIPQFIALMRADVAFKRALSEAALVSSLADELALVKTQVWTRSDVRTAWNTLIINAGVTAPSVGEVGAWNGYTALLPGLSFAANGEVNYAG